MTNLDSILKSRDNTSSTKISLVKAVVFPVVMYGCKSWTIKEAEHIRIDVFELWCWRRLLRVPWTARRSNQSIVKEISPGWSLEGLMLMVKLQFFSHLMQRADSFEKTVMLGKIVAGGEGDDRGWDSWMASPIQWTWVWVSSRSWWWTGRPGVLRFMGSQRVGHNWATEMNWTELINCFGLWMSSKIISDVNLIHHKAVKAQIRAGGYITKNFVVTCWVFCVCLGIKVCMMRFTVI